MAVFTAPFSAIAVSAASDLWEILAGTTTDIKIREIRFGQYSDAGDAAAEILGVTFRSGDSSSGSGGGTITPTNVKRGTGQVSALSTVERNNTTQASGGTVIWADTWNVQAPFLYLPTDDDVRFYVKAGTRFVVALTAPADALTMNGTITFDEVGHGLV